MGLAADEVRPGDGAAVEAEAPVGTPPLGLEPRAVLVREFEGGAVVDRRQAAAELAPALALELVGSLEGRVEPAEPLQALRRGVVEREPVRLAHGPVRGDAEPGKVPLDRFGELGARALDVRVVEAEHEGAALAPGEQGVEERRAGVADMEEARGGRGEADDGHRTALGCSRVDRA
jgi:hypothetical protein